MMRNGTGDGMNCAAIIIGIDGWQRYTLPLIESIHEHEPSCQMFVVDNASATPYPKRPNDPRNPLYACKRVERLCYSAAINHGKAMVGDADWYIVLSNDVLCTGPFAPILAEYTNAVAGPLIKDIAIERVGKVSYVEGWCVCIPRNVWDTIGGWDEGMQVSSYEDVEFSHRARMNGFELIEDSRLPFTHLDQRQRFGLVPNYWDSEVHNRARFIEKYGRVTA
jgi:hypothetical protein